MFKAESLAWSQVQGVFARGDTKLAEVLANLGEVSLAGWRRAMNQCGLDIEAYLYRRWDTDEGLPWAVLHSMKD